MKIILIICLIVFMLIRCEKPKYYYLDEATIYKFSEEDTIVYKSENSRDSVIVKDVLKSYFKGESSFSQVIVIELLPINVVFKDSFYFKEMHIFRSISHASVRFRNFESDIYDDFKTMEYKLDTLILPNVYRIEAIQRTKDIYNSIKTIFYCHKYGIVAYILKNDELYEMDENCIINKNLY